MNSVHTFIKNHKHIQYLNGFCRPVLIQPRSFASRRGYWPPTVANARWRLAASLGESQRKNTTVVTEIKGAHNLKIHENDV
jgi:hypothetical protein